METDWAENRSKIPMDALRRALGSVFDSMYSSNERDKFRTRIERAPGGRSEVYISHRGMEEVYTGKTSDTTVWKSRGTDPQLEAEQLSLLMVKLAPKAPNGPQTGPQTVEAARAAVAAAPELPPRARVVPGGAAAALEMDETFDRAWRRVGLALDRGGFTVEDRDRTAGLYFVRYIDPKAAGAEEPGFFGKLFGSKPAASSAAVRYRVQVKGQEQKTLVSVLNSAGAPENGENAQRIVGLLVNDLK
jgi:outer membrane protein assembly factor BamC